MKFGFIPPHHWGVENPQDVLAVAKRAEELGFDSVWVNHHVLHTGFVLDRLGSRPYYDTLTVLTYIAALTDKIRLGTSVIVLPYLNPIVLAKTLATLDVLSGGRLTVGIGVGGIREESVALGSNFAQRGAYTDEGIAIMKELWTEEDPSFQGRFYSFSGVKFSPKPLQKPHPPIWVGGHSPGALRRAARLGDAWHPSGLSPTELGKRLQDLKVQMSAAGRPMSEITIAARTELDVLDSPVAEPQEPMRGTPDQLLRSIESYRNLGVTEMVLAVSTSDINRIYAVMEAFAEKVLPTARG